MNRKSLAQLALVVLLLGLAAALYWGSSDAHRINLGPYEALGSIAAEEVSRALGGQGRIVVAVPDEDSGSDPVLRAELDAFREALKLHGRVTLSAIEPVKMDPFVRMRTGGAMPAEQFAALKQRHADAAGIVLFIGFPALMESEMAALKQDHAKVMVVSAALPHYESLVREGVIQFAIVPRSLSADDAAPPGKTLREVFDQEYVIMRRDPGQ